MRSVKSSWAVLWGACQALSVCAAGAPPPLALTLDSTLSLSSGAATPAPPSAATPAPKPLAVPVFLADEQLRAFNQEDFTLAFDVLLSAGDVERAFRVAQQAVQAVPRDKLWRLKLARVSEWTQRPLVAGEQWRTLFQQGERSDEVVTAVLRLMPLLNDPLMALQAWAERAKHGKLTEVQWKDIFALYESASEPAKGSLFFEAQFNANKDPLMLEYAARLAENAGQSERAEALYMQRTEFEPFSLDLMLRAVLSLIRRDRLAPALALMKANEYRVDAQAIEFWRLLGQVAWELREYPTAQGAYQRVTRAPQGVLAEWSRLIFLVRQQHPDQAADLALEAYRRFGASDQLLSALDLYASTGDTSAQERVFKSLSAQELAKAEQEVRFLLMRANFYQRKNLPDLAWPDLRQALFKAPNEKDTILAALWFLVDQKRTRKLALMLEQYRAQAEQDSAYWRIYATGEQLLQRDREALVWYSKEVRRNPDDALLLLDFAGALERMRNVGMATRIRRHAWLLLRQKYPNPDNFKNLGQNRELLAAARLAILNQPSDPGLRLVRQLVEQARGVSGAGQVDMNTSELILGWAITKEQFANARSWMWLRYAREKQGEAPLWGQSQTALQLGETPVLANLLAKHADELPIYNRYDTAHVLGDVQQALDIAFTNMASQGGDEPLHDRFRQHAPQQANYMQAQVNGENMGSLRTRELAFETRLMPHPKLQLTLGWSRTSQSSDSVGIATLGPYAERLDSVQARWLGYLGPSQLTMFRRSEFDRSMGLRLSQGFQVGTRLKFDVGLDWHSDSTVSIPMRIAGYENTLSGSVNYTLGKREYVRAAPRVSQYYSQSGDYLGSGRILDLEAGYRVRTEYPDWKVRAFASFQRFSDVSQAGANLGIKPSSGLGLGEVRQVSTVGFIPESSTTWGTCASMGENLGGQDLQTYSRGWRPFLDVCLNHNTLSGNSYTGAIGLVGSLTGEDHLSLRLQNSDGSLPGSAATQSMTLRYRYYF